MEEGGEMGAEEEGGGCAKNKEDKQQQKQSGATKGWFAVGGSGFAEESVFIEGGG